MAHVGAYEAKTYLPRLLARVQKGERIVITRHGHPVAELIPVTGRSEATIQHAIKRLGEFRSTHNLGNTAVRELIDEGRR